MSFEDTQENKSYWIKFIKKHRKKTPVFHTEKMKLIQKTDRLLIFKRKNQANLVISLNDLIMQEAFIKV